MGKLVYKGEIVDVPESRMAGLVEGGQYSYPAGTDVQVVDGDGTVSVSAEQEAEYAKQYGTRAQSADEWAGGQEDLRMDREHGGVVQGALTVGEAALGSATGGASDYIIGEGLGEGYQKDRRERREQHSGASGAWHGSDPRRQASQGAIS